MLYSFLDYSVPSPNYQKLIESHDFYCTFIIGCFLGKNVLLLNTTLSSVVEPWRHECEMLCQAAEHFAYSGGKRYGGKL